MVCIVRVQNCIAKRLIVRKTSISYDFCLCYNAIVKKFKQVINYDRTND